MDIAARKKNVSTRRASAVVRQLDEVVNHFAQRIRFFNEPLTRGRAEMFVMQHRQNTRQRNSVLKLKVATNCPVWDIKLRIIGACTEEIIADHEHGDGRPHWQVLEDLGVSIGMKRNEIRKAPLLDSTRLCWAAWEGLMANKHWIEGIVANTCAERFNVPGYGHGKIRELGWAGVERQRWGMLFDLKDKQLYFWEMHSEADIAHSNMGWEAVARFASDYKMGDAAVEACRVNLVVWEHYFNGIVAGGDALSKRR